MAIPQVYNLVRVTTVTTGTGTITLGAAAPGFLTFALGGVPDGATLRYSILDANGNRAVCHGVYSLTGLTLTRVHESSTTGSLLSLSGSAQVFITPAMADFPQAQGIASRDSNGVWNGRSVAATANGGLAVTNGDGIAGDPTLALGNYLPSWTGAVARAVAGRLQQVLSILDFGGAGDNTVDNSTPLANAKAALTGTGGIIFFPPGKYKFVTAVTLTLPASLFSITLAGCGADSTILYFPTTSGITVACQSAFNSVHAMDLSFTTGAANAGNGLALTNSVLLGNFGQNDVTRVTFRGDDGPGATFYWTTGLAIVGLSNVNYAGSLFFGSGAGAGNGVSVVGNAVTAPNYSIVHNLSKCGFFSLGVGLTYGSYVQGVTVDQCNFTNGNTGIYVPASAVGITQLSVQNSQFNTLLEQISINSPIAGLVASGNLLYIPANHIGIYFATTGKDATIVNNVFSGVSAVGSIGINVNGNVLTGIVTGNIFDTLAVGTNLPGTSTWNVQANKYNAVATHVGSPGTNSVGVATD